MFPAPVDPSDVQHDLVEVLGHLVEDFYRKCCPSNFLFDVRRQLVSDDPFVSSNLRRPIMQNIVSRLRQFAELFKHILDFSPLRFWPPLRFDDSFYVLTGCLGSASGENRRGDRSFDTHTSPQGGLHTFLDHGV